jgi:hypothetical protein
MQIDANDEHPANVIESIPASFDLAPKSNDASDLQPKKQSR